MRDARVIALLLLALTGGGCAVGPDYVRPQTPQATRYTATPTPERTAAAEISGGEAQRLAAGPDLPAQWWTLFESPTLDRLVQDALRANPTLDSAKAALRQAMENVAAQRGFYYPAVQASFAPTRQRNATGTLSPTLASGDNVFNLYTAQLAVSYAPDVFGLNRRQVESLQALADAQRFQLEAAYVTLTTNVVAAAIQEAALREQLRATETIAEVQREQVGIFQKQYDLGAIAYSDVVAQQAALAQTLAQLPVLKKQLAQQRDLIAALAGRLPPDQPADTFDLASLKLPQEVPLGLPSRLIEQRPDVRAAEEQVHAAAAQIGVATANLLPNITITAAKGGVATEIGQLFQTGNVFWAVGANVAQTLFAGGTLLARKRAAEAAFDQAAAIYRSTVIGAFQNVADALHALEFDAEALAAQVAAERAAAESLALARKSVELGAASYLALLNAQQTYAQALVNLAQARANRYADTAALFQALGGGWWNRDPEATARVQGQ